jgi:integrase/recombinase XerD
MKKNRNMMMDYVINDFMIYCKEKDLRPKTIFSYKTIPRLFARYIKDEHGIDNINE